MDVASIANWTLDNALIPADRLTERQMLVSVNWSTSPVVSAWVDNMTETAARNNSEMAEILKSAVKGLTTYAMPVICGLGIIGDITSFLIFVFTSFRYQPCSQYLAALTFVDTMFLLAQLISSFMTFFPTLALAPGYCSIMVYLSYVCSFLSAWFVVLMMLERYIVVCHPFRASTICSRKKSVTIISALTTVALLLYSHSFFTTDRSNNGESCTVDKELYKFIMIFTYIDSVLTFVIPFLTILFLNLRIIFTVRKFRLRHNLMNRSLYGSQRYYNADKTLSLAQVRSTKMLVRVSTVFVVLYLPSYAARLYGLVLQQVKGDDISEDSRFRLQIAQQICQFLYFLNFAVDFIVYVLTSNNFRRNVYRCLRKINVCKNAY